MNKTNIAAVHPVVFALRNLIGKLTQQPTVYAIKHYKKVNRSHKGRRLIAQ